MRLATALAVLVLSPGGPASASDLQAPSTAPAAPSGEEAAIRKVIADYGKAIETKDLELFKTVKPNLTKDEERRTRTAFEAVQSQVIKINILSVEVQALEAVVRVSRRDTLNGSIVSSFPQTFHLIKGKAGWSIQQIGK